MINILHCSPWPLGGATSYVVHLAKTLEVAEVPYRVVKLANKTEPRERPIGAYGVSYTNMSATHAANLDGPFLLASAPIDGSRSSVAVELVETSRGAYVFHDPNEFRIYPHWALRPEESRASVVCIRKAGLRHMPDGTFIPHPYVRRFSALERIQIHKTKLAASIARTSGVKNTNWILTANSCLPQAARVELFGEVNRMWWNFNVKPKFPNIELPPNAGFERRWGAAAELCKPFRFMVDLTVFKEDGGGTQYSFLEAMDAGAVPVMTKNWCSYPGVASKLGFQVSDAEELRVLLRAAHNRDTQVCEMSESLRQANYTYLDRVHNPIRIAGQYTKVLGV